MGTQCDLAQPIEVVLSLIDVYKFREDLEKDYTSEEVRVESEGNDVSLVIPALNRTSSIDYVVIDDPEDPEKKNKIKIKIENDLEG